MLALTTCAALLLAPGPPPAPGPVMPEVRWEAPPGCPDQAWVQAQIAGLLAQAPARTGEAPRVSLRVERLPAGRWRLDATITTRDGQGHRRLEGDRCEALAEAAALLTAIAAAPELQEGSPAVPRPEEAPGVQGAPGGKGTTPSQEPGSGSSAGRGNAAGPAGPGNAGPGSTGPGSTTGPAGPTGPAGLESATGPAGPGPAGPGSGAGPAGAGSSGAPGGSGSGPGLEEAPQVDAGELEPELPGASPRRATLSGASAPNRRRLTLKGTLGLGAGIGAGALPGVSALLRAAFGLRGRRWAVVLTQSFWLPRDLPAAEDERVGGRMWLAATGLQGCGIVGKGRVEAPLCAGVAAGAMRGRGIGELAASYRATSAWAAATAGPSLHVRVAPRVALTLGAELLVMLTRVRFEVAQRGEVCCSAPVGATATAGVEVRLP